MNKEISFSASKKQLKQKHRHEMAMLKKSFPDEPGRFKRAFSAVSKKYDKVRLGMHEKVNCWTNERITKLELKQRDPNQYEAYCLLEQIENRVEKILDNQAKGRAPTNQDHTIMTGMVMSMALMQVKWPDLCYSRIRTVQDAIKLIMENSQIQQQGEAANLVAAEANG